MNLYHIADIYKKTLSDLSEIEGLEEDVFRDTMAGIEYQLEENIINCAAFIQNIESDIEGMKTYESRMYDKRKRLERMQERLKTYIKNAMQECQIKKVKGLEFDVSVRAMPPKVIIENIDNIPDEYKTRKVEYKADSRAIQKTIMNGAEVRGAHLKEVFGLSIK